MLQDFGGLNLEHRESVAIAVRNAIKLGMSTSSGHRSMSEITIEIYLRGRDASTLVEYWHCGCARQDGTQVYDWSLLICLHLDDVVVFSCPTMTLAHYRRADTITLPSLA